MKIGLATDSLEHVGGSETYALTVADALQRLGHDVRLYATRHGDAVRRAEDLGLRTVARPEDLGDPDVLIVQDGAVSCDLARSHPSVPQVFVAHSDVFDLQLPLQLPGLVAVVVTLYERVDERIRALATPFEVVRLTQPVDVTRFVPLRALRDRPTVAVALGNYVRGPRAGHLLEACRLAGIELRPYGGFAADGTAVAPEVVYNEADIVFGKARVVVEALACGRAVYVYDHNGADGWVTPDRYDELVADNFGGQRGRPLGDARALADDLAGYDPAMGLAARDLALAHHSASRHAARLVEVLEGLVPRPAPVDAPLTELARLVRLAHRQDVRQFLLQAEVERLGHELHGRNLQRDAVADELAAANAALQDARSSAAAAAAAHAEQERADRERLEALRHELATARALEAGERARAQAAEQAAHAERAARDALVATRRWRTLQAVLRPADLLRRRSPGTAPAESPPAPFLVGVPRSGTTLLRLLLDAHPQLCIGPETGIALDLQDLTDRGVGAQEMAAHLAASATAPDLGWTREGLEPLLAGVRPWSPAAGVRAVLRDHAARHGKPRWGEKTPTHLRVVATIGALLPEAHVVHLVRDGRAVLLSVRDLPFAPGDGSVEAIADDWRSGVREARRQGAALGARYREVRYEVLVREPERVLRDLCVWLGLEYDPVMSRAHERASGLFAELPERLPDGTTREERLERHRWTTRPPDPSRADRWRTALSPDELGRFEAVAGDLLTELGYPLTQEDRT